MCSCSREEKLFRASQRVTPAFYIQVSYEKVSIKC